MEKYKSIRENIDFLKFMKFPGLNEKVLEERMYREKDSFHINGVMSVKDPEGSGQMAYTLYFKKYDQPDAHFPDKFRATLVDQPERQGVFLFDDRHPISATDAFHLLHGRSVVKPWGDDTQIGYKMDFTKRDNNGDGTIQMFGVNKKEVGLKHTTNKESQSPNQNKIERKQSWEIPLEKRNKKKRGISF